MNDLATVKELFAYTAWADAVVWTAVVADENARADARMRDYLLHIHAVQDRFLKIWRGEALDAPGFGADLDSILEAAPGIHERLAAFVGALDDTALGDEVTMPFAGRVKEMTGKEPGMSTTGDTLIQVVNHSTYHRGQVNARLRELGGTPPITDFIAWVLFDRPEASWPRPVAPGPTSD